MSRPFVALLLVGVLSPSLLADPLPYAFIPHVRRLRDANGDVSWHTGATQLFFEDQISLTLQNNTGGTDPDRVIWFAHVSIDGTSDTALKAPTGTWTRPAGVYRWDHGAQQQWEEADQAISTTVLDAWVSGALGCSGGSCNSTATGTDQWYQGFDDTLTVTGGTASPWNGTESVWSTSGPAFLMWSSAYVTHRNNADDFSVVGLIESAARQQYNSYQAARIAMETGGVIETAAEAGTLNLAVQAAAVKIDAGTIELEFSPEILFEVGLIDPGGTGSLVDNIGLLYRNGSTLLIRAQSGYEFPTNSTPPMVQSLLRYHADLPYWFVFLQPGYTANDLQALGYDPQYAMTALIPADPWVPLLSAMPSSL